LKKNTGEGTWGQKFAMKSKRGKPARNKGFSFNASTRGDRGEGAQGELGNIGGEKGKRGHGSRVGRDKKTIGIGKIQDKTLQKMG